MFTQLQNVGEKDMLLTTIWRISKDGLKVPLIKQESWKTLNNILI